MERTKKGFTTMEVPLRSRMAVSKEAKKHGYLIRVFSGMVIEEGLKFFSQKSCISNEMKKQQQEAVR